MKDLKGLPFKRPPFQKASLSNVSPLTCAMLLSSLEYAVAVALGRITVAVAARLDRAWFLEVHVHIRQSSLECAVAVGLGHIAVDV